MSDRFVTTIPLKPTPAQMSVLRVRFEAARQAYNALLGECLKRLNLMRQSRAWRDARRMPRSPERAKAFREIAKVHGFREFDLYPFIQRLRKHPAIGLHLDAHTVMALAARAFQTCERHRFKGGKIRFRRVGELNSVEGHTAKSSILWLDNRIRFGMKLIVDAAINPADPITAHGLRHRVMYSRIIRRTIRGESCYYAQLINVGQPYVKPGHRTRPGVVGLDLGPSTIAVVSDTSAELQRFADPLRIADAKRRRLQRRLSRRMRLNNQECFTSAGAGIRGKRIKWTEGMRQASAQLVETHRREREHRKNLHHRLAADVLRQGNDVRTEKLCYKSFQRNFGKSVTKRAPGMFVAVLKAMADKLGGCVTEFPTRTTRLSQTCICGAIRNKKLSERVHRCECGVTANRDVFSAYLACHVQGYRLDIASARAGWQRLCNAADVMTSVKNETMGRGLPCARLIAEPTEVSSRRNAVKNLVNASDAVAGRKVQARADETPEVCGDDGIADYANLSLLQVVPFNRFDSYSSVHDRSNPPFK